jgi:hypothetical protein
MATKKYTRFIEQCKLMENPSWLIHWRMIFVMSCLQTFAVLFVVKIFLIEYRRIGCD